MIFDIFVGMMLLLNFAGVVLTLSAVGHLLDRIRNAARSQAVLTVDMAKVILDTIRKEFEDRNFQYDYLADCASRCTYALTQDPDSNRSTVPNLLPNSPMIRLRRSTRCIPALSHIGTILRPRKRLRP